MTIYNTIFCNIIVRVLEIYLMYYYKLPYDSENRHMVCYLLLYNCKSDWVYQIFSHSSFNVFGYRANCYYVIVRAFSGINGYPQRHFQKNVSQSSVNKFRIYRTRWPPKLYFFLYNSKCVSGFIYCNDIYYCKIVTRDKIW